MFKIVGKKRARDNKAQELSLLNLLKNAKASIQAEPYSLPTMELVAKTKHDLRKLQAKKIQGTRIRSRVNWLKMDDRWSIFFFQNTKI